MQQVWYHILTVNLIMLSSSTDSATFSINVFWISERGGRFTKYPMIFRNIISKFIVRPTYDSY